MSNALHFRVEPANYYCGMHITAVGDDWGVFSFRLNNLRLKYRMFQGFSDTVGTPLSFTVCFLRYLSSLSPTCLENSQF